MDRDIVERLREGTGPIKPNLIDDAADTIERLRARVGQLEADASALAKGLTSELDAARREVCSLEADTTEGQWEYARQRGWHCFKEDGK
jgi:hypothetical protein